MEMDDKQRETYIHIFVLPPQEPPEVRFTTTTESKRRESTATNFLSRRAEKSE